MNRPRSDVLRQLAEQSLPAIQLAGILSSMAAAPLRLEWLVEQSASLPSALSQALSAEKTREELLEAMGRMGSLKIAEDGWLTSTKELIEEAQGDAFRKEAPEWTRSALSWLDAAFPEDSGDVRYWSACSALLPHVSAATTRALDLGLQERAVLSLLNRAAVYEIARDNYPSAQELIQQAMPACAESEHPDLIGESHLVRGELLTDLGEWEAARKELNMAIDVLELSVDAGHPFLRRAFLLMALLRIELEEIEAAEEALKRAIAEQPSDSADRIACITHKILGWILSEKGDQDAAEEQYQLALSLAEDVLGPDHPDTAGVLSSIGVLQFELGNLDEAEAAQRRVLDIFEGSLGEGHLRVAGIYSTLSDVLVALGEPIAARLYLQKSITIAERTLPPIHRVLWIRHRKLATVANNLGATREAQTHAEQAVAICEELYGVNHLNFAHDVGLLATIKASHGELPAARDDYERTLSLMRRNAPTERADIARYTQSLARVLRDLGDLPGARDRLSESLHQFEDLGAADDIAASRIDLVDVFERIAEEAAAAAAALGREEDANALRGTAIATFEVVLDDLLSDADIGTAIAVADSARRCSLAVANRALERVEELFDDQVPGERLRAASAWHRLGQDRSAKRDLPEAKKAFERALVLLEGFEHFQAAVLHEVGTLFYREENHSAAIEHFYKAAELKRRLGDNGDPRTLAETLIALGRSYEEVGDYKQATTIYEERLQILRSLSQQDPQAEGVTLHDMADVLWAEDRHEEAVKLYSQAAERKREAGESPRDLGVTLGSLGDALKDLERYDEAHEAYAQHLEILESLPERDVEAESAALQDLGSIHRTMNQPDLAVEFCRRAVSLRREVNPKGPELAYSLFTLGRTLEQLNDLEEAQQAYEERLEILPGLPEKKPQAEGVTLHDLGDVLRARGHLEKASEIYRKAIERKREADTAPAKSLAVSLLALASTEHSIGRDRQETKEAADEALAALQALEDPDNYELASAFVLVGDVATSENRHAAAASAYEKAAERFAQIANPDLVEFASLQFMAGDAYAAAERADEAKKARQLAKEVFEEILNGSVNLRRALTIPTMAMHCIRLGSRDLGTQAAAVMRSLREKHPAEERLAEGLVEILLGLGRAQEESKEFVEAAETYNERLDILESMSQSDPQAEGITLHDLGDVQMEQNNPAEAAAYYRRAIQRKREGGDRIPQVQLAMSLTAACRAEMEVDPQAQPVEDVGEAIEIYRAMGDAAHDSLAASLSLLAACHLRRDRPEEALTTAKESEAILDDDPSIDMPIKRATLKQQAGRALRKMGKDDEAEAAFAEAEKLEESSTSG